jgi:hypothetical protein
MLDLVTGRCSIHPQRFVVIPFGFGSGHWLLSLRSSPLDHIRIYRDQNDTAMRLATESTHELRLVRT